MKMRKIVAIAAAVLMLLSILPFTAMAADTEITFELGANGSASHNDGSEKSSYSETVNGYTLSITGGSKMYTGARDQKGNSCIKLGTSSAVGKFSFTVPADVTKVIIKVAKYKANTTKMNINGAAYTLTNSSNDGVYDAIEVDTSTTKTVSVTSVSGGYRAMVNSITYVVAGSDEPDCEHEWDNACDTECNLGCGETREIQHDYVEDIIEATCTQTGTATYECSVCGNSYDEEIPTIPHNYVDGACSFCGEEEPSITEYTITFDANKTQRTEFSTTKQVWKNGALTFTNNKASSTSAVADYGAPVRLYASSEIVIECVGMTQIVFDCNTAAYATTLKSSIGNAATVSGDKVTVAVSDNTLSFTLSGQVRMDSITVTAEAQDTATCEHENAKECDAYCPDCGELINEGATHVSDAQYPCYAGTCIYCGDAIEAVDHVLDENDVCTVCGLAPTPENPVDPENPQEYVFKNFTAGTQYAENEKHFLDNAVTVITNQAHFTEQLRIYSSTTNNGTVVIKSKKDISAIVLNAGNKKDVLNVYVSEDGEIYEAIEITATTYNDYTLLIPEMTKYIKLDVAGENQVRIAKMTLYFDGKVPHTHEYDNDCDVDCNTCGETREVEHNVAHVEAKDATCYENGNIEYWYCETCGQAWLDAECTLNTNLMAVILPMGHGTITHVEAKDATCAALGNIEYWFCEACGQAWLDAECTLNTNLMAVILPMAEHTYDNDYDADCNDCGAIREAKVLPVTFGGNSVSEDVSGLAFKFDVNVEGMEVINNTEAVYANATINGYKLIDMGALASNGAAELTIPAKYLCKLTADSASFAVRIINIPEDHLDTEITVTPYFVVEIEEGVETTIYGDKQIANYNEVMNVNG